MCLSPCVQKRLILLQLCLLWTVRKPAHCCRHDYETASQNVTEVVFSVVVGSDHSSDELQELCSIVRTLEEEAGGERVVKVRGAGETL